MIRTVAAVLAVVLLALAWMRVRDRENVPAIEMYSRPEPVSTELPRMWTAPDFALTERSGQPVALADLRGKVWVIDFFYSTCPGPCPMLKSRLSTLHKTFANEPDVRLVSVSIDPEKDTPEVLKGYATQFGASDRWLFLTGDKAKIHDLAQRGFKLSVTEDRTQPMPITHSTRVLLVDRSGVVRGAYEGTTEEGIEKVSRDIRRLLAELPGQNTTGMSRRP